MVKLNCNGNMRVGYILSGDGIVLVNANKMFEV